MIPEQKAKMRAALPKKKRVTKRRGKHPDKALSAAFCRNVTEAGRYCDDRHEKRVSHSQLTGYW